MILAGGLSRRMGVEKGLIAFGGKPLISHVLERLGPQVDRLVINANGDARRFQEFSREVIPDKRADYPGPLAGMEAAFLATDAAWLVTASVDLPFLPRDLVAKLSAGMGEGPTAVVAESCQRTHPVVGLWPRSVLPAITRALDEGQLRLMRWLTHLPHRRVDFPLSATGRDPFANLNSPADFRRAEGWLSSVD
ncbi:MAG: molybdenum cofactor guanylyltransferase MobA [Magnetococcales bacterium]|nr:molybdenum cofactor guanylyltransferase MobA [Magnetococcales bacterium]